MLKKKISNYFLIILFLLLILISVFINKEYFTSPPTVSSCAEMNFQNMKQGETEQKIVFSSVWDSASEKVVNSCKAVDKHPPLKLYEKNPEVGKLYAIWSPTEKALIKMDGPNSFTLVYSEDGKLPFDAPDINNYLFLVTKGSGNKPGQPYRNSPWWNNTGYRGKLNKDENGYPCQYWTSNWPNRHSRTPSNYPNTGLGNHNYCRNPDGENDFWCYGGNKGVPKRWTRCKIEDDTNPLYNPENHVGLKNVGMNEFIRIGPFRRGFINNDLTTAGESPTQVRTFVARDGKTRERKPSFYQTWGSENLYIKPTGDGDSVSIFGVYYREFLNAHPEWSKILKPFGLAPLHSRKKVENNGVVENEGELSSNSNWGKFIFINSTFNVTLNRPSQNVSIKQ